MSGRFAPAMLEPEPDYPPRIVAVLSAVRTTESSRVGLDERQLVRSHSFILCNTQRMSKPRPTRSSRLLRAAQDLQRRRLAEQDAARTGIPPGGPLWTMPRWRKAVAKMGRGGAPVAAAV